MELLVFLIVLVLLILSIARFRLSPFLALLFLGLVYGILSGINPTQALTVLLDGFAQTLRWIAVIMIFGTLIGVLLALFQFGKKFQMERVTKLTKKSIEKAALVIMITAAGGAFGHIIQESGIVDKISGFTQYAGNLGFLFPFLLAALFTTTTGSLTVSMITTASVVMPLLPALNMSPQLAAALIGSGSFCVFHVNSSFFWLLNRLHDVPSGILLKTFTVQSLCMGLGGLFSVILMRIFGVL
jgi:gluconate:H+ symporter, GntP family